MDRQSRSQHHQGDTKDCREKIRKLRKGRAAPRQRDSGIARKPSSEPRNRRRVAGKQWALFGVARDLRGRVANTLCALGYLINYPTDGSIGARIGQRNILNNL
jgi:hypothetical protein